MESQRETFPFEDEELSTRAIRKAKESPFLMVGLAGLVATCAFGAYKYKHRGNMSTSIFLTQLRVIAQGAVVGSLTIGMVYNMVNDYVLKKKK